MANRPLLERLREPSSPRQIRRVRLEAEAANKIEELQQALNNRVNEDYTRKRVPVRKEWNGGYN